MTGWAQRMAEEHEEREAQRDRMEKLIPELEARIDALAERMKALQEPPMTLARAINILATVHTRADDQVGFLIIAGAHWSDYHCPFSQEEYAEAWRTLRLQSNMPVNPT